MSLYQERHGLPALRPIPPEKRKSPLVRELQRLAQLPGIVDHFLPTMEGFNPDRKESQEVMKLLDWGRRYHRSLLSDVLGEANGVGTMEVDVLVPVVEKSEDGKRSVSVPVGSPRLAATLLGIIGARPNGRDNLSVLFDGVVILRGKKAYEHNALLVSIDSDTGIMYFHPDFMPNEERTKTIAGVIPQFRYSRPVGQR